MDAGDRIELAHEPNLRWGALEVCPVTRELVHADGRREALEPRVMQVLVFLARAKGGVVTRDELAHWCWNGRVVGDDVINRVLSRLRRASEGIGAGIFRIETLTKVGYRLIVAMPEERGDAPAPQPASSRPSRRQALIAGGAIAGVAAAGGLGAVFLHRRRGDAPPTPQIAAMIDEASNAFWQLGADGGSQAVGLLRQVVDQAPDYADGWGQLAIYQAEASRHEAPSEIARIAAYTRESIRKANALDPGNAYAAIAAEYLQSTRGRWAQNERALRNALIRHPANRDLLGRLALLLESVGRIGDAITAMERCFAIRNPGPGLAYAYGRLLWSADRLDDADRWMDHVYAAYPRNYAVWFTRFFYLMYTGRYDQALAMDRDVDMRPDGIPESQFGPIERVAIALQTRAPDKVDAVVRDAVEAAHHATGHAENAIQYASALGRLDDAFRVADAYYFSRGFEVSPLRFTKPQCCYLFLSERRTWFLFTPSTAEMRTDPRFAKLTAELGLERYWRDVGVVPDFRRR